MADVRLSTQASSSDALPLLESGDHLDQPAFHERYQQMPSDFRAELIGGFVVVPSPLSQKHARYHAHVIRWLGQYEADTCGAAVYDNATVILGPDSELQPDACLIVEPDCGGRTNTDRRGYVMGPPELIVEVASSSESYDLHDKRREYERAGVQEYLVVVIRDQRIRSFRLHDGRYNERPVDADGIWRSSIFPDLWLDTKALLDLDSAKVDQTQRAGMATPAAHATFVQALRTHPASQ